MSGSDSAKLSHLSFCLAPSLGSYPQSRRCSSRRCRKSPKPTKGSQWRTRSCCGSCTTAFHPETLLPFPAPLFRPDDLWPWTCIDFLSLLWVTCTVFKNLTSLFPEMANVLVRMCVWDRADVAQTHFQTEEHALLCHFSFLFILFHSFFKEGNTPQGLYIDSVLLVPPWSLHFTFISKV